MAEEFFVVVTWNDADDEIVDKRLEANPESAAQTVVDDDPRVDVWNIKLLTNRNAASLHKTTVKAGPRDPLVELQLITAAGDDVGEIEVRLP